MSTRARWQSQNNSPSGISYSTAFPATENPISESGRWTNGGATGLDWQNVRTTAGKAYGSGFSDGSAGYNDNIACLAGFPANQSAQATIYHDPAYTAPDTHEIELLLRFQITANVARGYEIDCSFPTGSAIIQIIRWNGALSDFTVLTTSGANITTLDTSDTIKAGIVGNLITVYKNGVSVLTATDSTYTNGNPGMGYFIRPGGTPDRYCISQFTAAGL